MTTRTEWLVSLQSADRVTLQDVMTTVKAYLPTPDEIAAFLVYLETLAAGLRLIVYPEGDEEQGSTSPNVPEGPVPVADPAVSAAVPETTPTPEEVI